MGFFASVAKILVKHAGNAVGFGLGNAALEIWSEWNRETPDNQAKLAQVQETANLTTGDTKKLAEQIVLEVAGDQPEAVRQEIAAVLTQLPAATRKSLRRPADPSGLSLRPSMRLDGPDALRALLPERLPKYKPGEKPLPSVDLQLVELLGIGGFGEVWKAKNPHADGVAPVALKFCTDAEAAKTLRYEVGVLNEVMRPGRHPGIVQLKNSYLSANPPCLEYELIAGGDLAGVIQDWHRSGTFSAGGATRLMLELASIIGYAHRLNPPIVHRDLKPGNILVQRGDGDTIQLKVADFGIGGIAAGLALKETEKPNWQVTSLATGTCTLLYASPEQAAGKKADPRDDVHALGVIWLQMLTGNLNAGRPSGLSWRRKLIEQGMAVPLVELLESCFDEEESRPRDAAELAERLKSLVAPVAAPVGGPPGEKEPAIDEQQWRDNYPGALGCALWYRELLSRFCRVERTKFAKGYITLYVGGRVRVWVSPRKNSRARLGVHHLQGDFAEAVDHVTRQGIEFVPKENNSITFNNVDLHELKAKEATHAWIAQRLVGPAIGPPLPSAIDSSTRKLTEDGDEDDGIEYPDDGETSEGLSDENHWGANYPGPLSCALWYRDLLTKFYSPEDVRTKFGKGHITLYMGGSVRVGVSPRKKPRALVSLHYLEGNCAEAADRLTREGIAFKTAHNNQFLRIIVDLQELKAKHATHEWLAQRLLGSSNSALLPDIPDDERNAEQLSEGSGEKLKRFWEGLLSRPRVNATRHANLTPKESVAIGTGSGVRGLGLYYVIRQDDGKIELYINRGTGKAEENKRIFDRLREQKGEIDAAFGSELSWERLDQKQASRIACYIRLGGYKSDESKWPEIQDAMIDAMIRLEKALASQLEKLKSELASEGG